GCRRRELAYPCTSRRRSPAPISGRRSRRRPVSRRSKSQRERSGVREWPYELVQCYISSGWRPEACRLEVAEGLSFVSAAQVLEHLMVDCLADETHRAVGKCEHRSVGVPRLEAIGKLLRVARGGVAGRIGDLVRSLAGRHFINGSNR